MHQLVSLLMIRIISNCEFLLANRKLEPQKPVAKDQHFQGFVGEEDTSNSCIALYMRKKNRFITFAYDTSSKLPNFSCTFKSKANSYGRLLDVRFFAAFF
jgi:hypothetical protein